MTKKRKNNTNSRFNIDLAGPSVAKTQKNIRELSYSIKWKKISSVRTEILAAAEDGSEIISIGFANYRVATRKWTIETSFKAREHLFRSLAKSKTFYTDIEAGRALKELWIHTKKYNEFQDNLDKIIMTKDNTTPYTPMNTNNNNSVGARGYYRAPYGGDESFSDDEWEELLSDFSLDGD